MKEGEGEKGSRWPSSAPYGYSGRCFRSHKQGSAWVLAQTTESQLKRWGLRCATNDYCCSDMRRIKDKEVIGHFLLCNNTQIQTSLGPIGHFSSNRIFLFFLLALYLSHFLSMTGTKTFIVTYWKIELEKGETEIWSELVLLNIVFYNTVSCRKCGFIPCKNFSTYLSYWHSDPHLEHFVNYPYLFHILVFNYYRHAFF